MILIDKTELRKKPNAEVLGKELAKLDPKILELAYAYASNIDKYGVDVTKQWETAIEQSNAMRKAYMTGYHDAMILRRKDGE
jgi:hypothetical protein